MVSAQYMYSECLLHIPSMKPFPCLSLYGRVAYLLSGPILYSELSQFLAHFGALALWLTHPPARSPTHSGAVSLSHYPAVEVGTVAYLWYS